MQNRRWRSERYGPIIHFPPEILVTIILRLLVGNGIVVDFGDVDGTAELAPKAIKKMRLLLDALLPGLKVVRQVGRQVSLEHLVVHG